MVLNPYLLAAAEFFKSMAKWQHVPISVIVNGNLCVVSKKGKPGIKYNTISIRVTGDKYVTDVWGVGSVEMSDPNCMDILFDMVLDALNLKRSKSTILQYNNVNLLVSVESVRHRPGPMLGYTQTGNPADEFGFNFDVKSESELPFLDELWEVAPATPQTEIIGAAGEENAEWLAGYFACDFTGYSRRITFGDGLLELVNRDDFGAKLGRLDRLVRGRLAGLLDEVLGPLAHVVVNLAAECDYFLDAFPGSSEAEAKTRVRERAFVRGIVGDLRKWDYSGCKQLPDEWCEGLHPCYQL